MINEQFQTKGAFCSFECCKAYSMSTSDNHRGARNSMLMLMRKQMTGEPSTTQIREAPSKHVLKMFGGSKTIDEYRAGFSKVRYVHADLPMIHHLELRFLQEPIAMSGPEIGVPRLAQKRDASSISVAKNEPLKLQRKTAVKGGKQNTLVASMCIKVTPHGADAASNQETPAT